MVTLENTTKIVKSNEKKKLNETINAVLPISKWDSSTVIPKKVLIKQVMFKIYIRESKEINGWIKIWWIIMVNG